MLIINYSFVHKGVKVLKPMPKSAIKAEDEEISR